MYHSPLFDVESFIKVAKALHLYVMDGSVSCALSIRLAPLHPSQRGGYTRLSTDVYMTKKSLQRGL